MQGIDFGFMDEGYVPPVIKHSESGVWSGYVVNQGYQGKWVGIIVCACGHTKAIRYDGSSRGVRAYVRVRRTCEDCE